MSERKRRGVVEDAPVYTKNRPEDGWPNTEKAPMPLVEGDTRWLMKVSTTVFEGYFWGTEEQARELDEKLRADTRLSSGVYLRSYMRQEKTDYTDIQQVLDDVELAIPKS